MTSRRRRPSRVLEEFLDAAADSAGERRLLEAYADLRVVSRPHGADAPSPQQYLHAFLRSLDPAAEGLPDRFVAGLERALRHYGIAGLERTAALEAACYRLFLSRQRSGTASTAVRAILERHLEQAGERPEREDDELRGARPAGGGGGRDGPAWPAAREVRWRVVTNRGEGAAREVYTDADEHIAATRAGNPAARSVCSGSGVISIFPRSEMTQKSR